MTPRIETLPPKKLIGQRLQMSLADDKIFLLWRGFMPRRKEISQVISTALYSVDVYTPFLDLQTFSPQTLFEKWAAIEVADFNSIPDGMEPLELTGGLYAVFLYKGTPDRFVEMAQYIFGAWFPASTYELDNRPHFALMGNKYKNNDPDSEEEIWVPVKARA